MKITAWKAKELEISTPNQVGAGATVAAVLAEQKINILGLCGYSGENGKAHLLMVLDDPAKATKALRKAKYGITANDVVLVEMPRSPGALLAVMNKLATKDVDIDYAYATGAGNKSCVVLRVKKPSVAIKALS